MTTITNDIKNLESLFSKLNERFFDNQLEVPLITVSPVYMELGVGLRHGGYGKLKIIKRIIMR